MSGAVAVPEQLVGAREIVAASADDPYARAWTGTDEELQGWRHPDGAVGWLRPSHREAGRNLLICLGKPPSAAALFQWVVQDQPGTVGGFTLPRGITEHLAPAYRMMLRNDWEWFATWSPPPHQPGEDAVGWLGHDGIIDGAHGDEVHDFLERWSPRHDVKPGQRHARRWCGTRDDEGHLTAVAAETVHVADVPFLASIATHGDLRGRGLGAAVTAWLTRRLLAEGRGWVTLGMYSDNDVARRIYLRLGYRCEHLFTSGRIPQRTS